LFGRPAWPSPGELSAWISSVGSEARAPALWGEPPAERRGLRRAPRPTPAGRAGATPGRRLDRQRSWKEAVVLARSWPSACRAVGSVSSGCRRNFRYADGPTAATPRLGVYAVGSTREYIRGPMTNVLW